MTIRSKLALGLFSIAIVLLLPLALALQSLERLHVTTTLLQKREFAASLLMNRLRSGTDELRRLELTLAVIPTRENRRAVDSQLVALTARTDSLRALGMPEAADRIGASVAKIANYLPAEYAALAAGHGEKADSISARQLRPAITDTERELTLAEAELRDRTSHLVAAATDETAAARNAAALALAVAGTLALIISVILWRSISRPVVDLEHGMAAVADGNFGYRLKIATKRRDEFGRLAQSFESMAHQLAQLDRLKAEFISIASHELKTPINVIVGYLQLVDEEVYGPVSDKQREVLRTIDAQTRSLARLVHQLLDISRFEAGGGKLELRPVQLDHFLEELESTFRVLAMQRGVNFQLVQTGTLPCEVLWDRDRMSEVLGNLLSNAFKFTERGGSVELVAEAADDGLRLTVHDTGAGIPPRQLAHIFEKFYQADNQGSAAHGGTGLGLAIAKQIVAAHGGDIAVESVVGAGTTFRIVLPERAGGVRRPGLRVSPGAPGAGVIA
ncbi:MAG TPA: HAMP domain-containing sensor histidine kinase [Gemmatimonadaceae bacterium]|nr:HAMP domain-containing sensor histidine kinase [Gemmatimonadaceae bacterium]